MTNNTKTLTNALARIEELERERDIYKRAVEWYGEKATAAYRYLAKFKENSDPAPIMALLTELALDNGTRAVQAIADAEGVKEQ